jgi:hypothetical protein
MKATNMKQQTHTKQTHPAAQAKPSHTPRSHPRHEEISARAHEIYLTRGGAHGNDLDDWLLAEYELKQKQSQSLK